MKTLLAAAGVAALLIATPAMAQTPGAPDVSRVAAATYKVDSNHTQVVWSLDHMGFSILYGMFGSMSGTLTLDPAKPEAAKVSIEIPMSGLTTTSAGFTKHLSGADFFDVEKFPGTRGIPGYADPEGYMVELGLMADGVPRDQMFPADIDRGLNKWRSIREHLVPWTTGAESQQMLEAGEADMVMVWSGRGKAALANGANYEPVWQDWIVVKDQITIPMGVKDPDAAHALINAYLGKEAQEIMAQETSYSPIHVDAQPKVDELTAAFMTNTPEKQAMAYNQNVEYWVENYELLGEKWAEFIAGN